MKPVWQSSNLDRPNYEAGLADLDGDGTNELVVVEGTMKIPGCGKPVPGDGTAGASPRSLTRIPRICDIREGPE